MKLRIHIALHRRLSECARDIGEPTTEFVDLCWTNHLRARFPVADDAEMLCATSSNSTVITINIEDEDAKEVRQAILDGVTYAESRMRPRYVPELKEGIGYLVGAVE